MKLDTWTSDAQATFGHCFELYLMCEHVKWNKNSSRQNEHDLYCHLQFVAHRLYRTARDRFFPKLIQDFSKSHFKEQRCDFILALASVPFAELGQSGLSKSQNYLKQNEAVQLETALEKACLLLNKGYQTNYLLHLTASLKNRDWQLHYIKLHANVFHVSQVASTTLKQ